MREKAFPPVSDDEIMLADMPQMNLYEEQDFISNIRGDYVDKNYLDWEPIGGFEQKKENREDLPQKKPKTSGALAREEARADLKKKRSAAYLTQQVQPKRHQTGLSSQLARPLPAFSGEKKLSSQPTAPFQKEKPGEFAKYSKNLRQESYILADLPRTYPVRQDKNPAKPQKNSYEFLKKSQIYNQKDQPSPRERRIAQELNLTSLDQKEKL